MEVSHKLEDLHDLHEDLLVMLKLITSTNKRQSSVKCYSKLINKDLKKTT